MFILEANQCVPQCKHSCRATFLWVKGKVKKHEIAESLHQEAKSKKCKAFLILAFNNIVASNTIVSQ